MRFTMCGCEVTFHVCACPRICTSLCVNVGHLALFFVLDGAALVGCPTISLEAASSPPTTERGRQLRWMYCSPFLNRERSGRRTMRGGMATEGDSSVERPIVVGVEARHLQCIPLEKN